MGVCRIVSSKSDDGGSGFGIVTLASLFPILAVFLLGFYHLHLDDFYGRPNYKKPLIKIQKPTNVVKKNFSQKTIITKTEYSQFIKNPKSSNLKTELTFIGGDYEYKDGKIYHISPTLVYTKKLDSHIEKDSIKAWNPGLNILNEIKLSGIIATQAILPLCLFLYITLRFVLKENIRHSDEIFLGVFFSIIGMSVFILGISLGLNPLGGQLGANIPGAFTTIVPWELEGYKVPIMQGHLGKLLACVFAFFLGYGATLAEPALNALGATVEKITIGAFKKSLLMTTVATGVGTGIALGILKIAYNIPLEYLLLPPYLILIGLTLISSEAFVNFGWDSAGVTTGPITVPLVLAMGLGVGSNVPNVTDGFGVLALASVAPIIAVLIVGLLVKNPSQKVEDPT
ncbi:hypothetical protein DID77_02710 [Candidatus Marinamargulisbacteria bacterium SCGC AG-439-L15]|nr:hypothetical protein DID77_02710 [Candidatus Marinamargulisbacteria bacterium SCGC AG-439-L15]